MSKLYVSNKDESVQMFKSYFLEIFTHVHPAVPHLIFVPAVSYMFYLSYEKGVALTSAALLFIFGLFIWSFTEYILHRFVFHFHPRSALGQRLFFIIHGVHHDYPNDSNRLVMPPVVSVPLAVLFYFLFNTILGAHHLPPFFAGFLVGYLLYDTTHYAIHHFRLHGKIGLLLKQHHMRHHYMDSNHNFGVSSPLWDFVFGTFRGRKFL